MVTYNGYYLLPLSPFAVPSDRNEFRSDDIRAVLPAMSDVDGVGGGGGGGSSVCSSA